MPVNPNPPSMAELFMLLRKDIFLNLNCHAVATIRGFNPATQRVRAQIAYKRTFHAGPKMLDKVTEDYPLLVDCPVVILGGGPANLTFPIAEGDTCLILFNDRDYDAWLSSGQVKAPGTSRMHSLSDGIALVGLRSAQNAITDYDTSRASLRNGAARVAVGSTKILIENGSGSLLEALTLLTQGLSTFASSAATADPSLASAAGALATAVDNAASALGGLLE